MVNGCACRRMLDLMCKIYNTVPYQLAQARPYNVLHFLVTAVGAVETR